MAGNVHRVATTRVDLNPTTASRSQDASLAIVFPCGVHNQTVYISFCFTDNTLMLCVCISEQPNTVQTTTRIQAMHNNAFLQGSNYVLSHLFVNLFIFFFPSLFFLFFLSSTFQFFYYSVESIHNACNVQDRLRCFSHWLYL